MSKREVVYRPRDEIETLSLARVKATGAVNPTPAQEFACCIWHVREGGEATPPNKFNCPTLISQSRRHELVTQLREKLETEGRTAMKWAGPKWVKGKMINVLFGAWVTVIHENASLEIQVATMSKKLEAK